MLKLLEPSVHQSDLSRKPANHFALPPIDNILDFCKNRDDFPQHLVQSGPGIRKRRRSLVKEFLTFGVSPYAVALNDEEPGVPRRRALSVDEQAGFKVTTWFKDQDHHLAASAPMQEATLPQLMHHSPVSFRRHSMVEKSMDDPLFSTPKKGVIRPWSIDEDNTLLEAVKKYGPQWTKISYIIPGRKCLSIVVYSCYSF